MNLEWGKYYRIKIIDDRLGKLCGAVAKAKYSGLYFRGKEKENKLFVDQCEVIEEISEEEFYGGKRRYY